jgi:hypothetical protein
MFDDIQIGRLGGTNVRETKFAELGLVLHPNPLWSRGVTRRRTSSGWRKRYRNSGLKMRREPSWTGEKTALSDSPVSVIAWMRLQVIGNILILRNFGIFLSENLEPC